MQKLFSFKLEVRMQHEILVIETSDNFRYMQVTEFLIVSSYQFILSQSPKAIMVMQKAAQSRIDHMTLQWKGKKKLVPSVLAQKYLVILPRKYVMHLRKLFCMHTFSASKFD